MGCRWSSSSTTPSYNHHHDAGAVPAPTLTATEKPLRLIHLTNHNNNKPLRRTKKKKGEQQQQQQQTHGQLSPIYYDSLPRKAKKFSVYSVYDGDTLTVTIKKEKKRVRLLGIDTPELKNPTQAFSQEAKEYTRVRCENQSIWLSFIEPAAATTTTTGQKKGRMKETAPTEDRYGRLLAWVWVATGDGRYECVNEGLLQTGLATVYKPSNANKLSNMDNLLALQKEARLSRRGIWKNWRDFVVVKTPHGSAFHHRNAKCEHLKRSVNLRQVMASEALNGGCHACRTCLADDEHENNGAKTKSFVASVY